MNLHSYLISGSKNYPGKTALIFQDRQWNYREFDEITDRIARSFLQLGIQPGDRVALHLPNCPELIFSYFACFKIGAIAVPLITLLKASELTYILNHCGAKLCISHPESYGELVKIQSELPQLDLDRYYLLDGDDPTAGFQSFSTLLNAGDPQSPFPTIGADAIAAILYTSGTTARPKGVTHSHATLDITARNYIEWIDLKSTDITLGMLSLSHIFGFSLQLLTTTIVGGSLIILPDRDPARLLQSIESHRATKLYGLPVMYSSVVNYPAIGDYDLSSLTAAYVGGDRVPQILHDRFHQLFGIPLSEGCGMTEIVPYTMQPAHRQPRIGSIGLCTLGMKIRLVDATGRDVAMGEVGEVWVKGAALMLGYWEDPQATAAVMHDGWLATGDLVKQDRDGYYWFVSRQKEIIVCGGSNISPLEIEEVLYQHPAVKEAAAIGVPDLEWGEIVCAYVALYADLQVTSASLQVFVSDRLADRKVPRQIYFLPELPKGLTGKIQRKTLKELLIN
jgi:long-chain acyl-CoA synthetase